MGGDAKLSTVVVVAAVRSDYGVELHLKANPGSQTEPFSEPLESRRHATFLAGAGTENLTGSYLVLYFLSNVPPLYKGISLKGCSSSST